MRITQPVFDSFLHCPTKAYLVACGEVGFGAQADLAGIADNYHRDAVAEESHRGIAAIDVENSRMAGRIITVRGRLRTRQRSAEYIPVRFTPDEEVTATDRLSLAFDGLLLASREGTNPSSGEIVHGREYAAARVSLSALYPKVRSNLRSLERVLDSPAAPAPILNRHCPECP
jgi:hypothetical protein